MNINKWLVFAFLMSSSSVFANLCEPQARPLKIAANTSDVINVAFGRSVKIIFPWILDNYYEEIPYSAYIADTSVFNYEHIDGQNYLTIYYSGKGADFTGEKVDLFVNIAGYHFSFLLNAISDCKRHYSTITLELGDADKLMILSKEKAKIRKVLRDDFKKKEDELDKRAEKMALKYAGKLAFSKPDTTTVREEKVLELSGGDELILYVDSVASYDNINVLPIELEYSASKGKVEINNIALFKVSNNQAKKPLYIEYELPSFVRADQTINGYAVTNDLHFESAGDTELVISTDNGEVTLVW